MREYNAPPQNFFLTLGSQNAYFGAFSDPPESDSVVPIYDVISEH